MNAGKSDFESLEFLLPKNLNTERLGKVIVMDTFSSQLLRISLDHIPN